MTPEREKEIKDDIRDGYAGVKFSAIMTELLTEIDRLRITHSYELEAMNSIGHERIVAIEKERDQLRAENETLTAQISIDSREVTALSGRISTLEAQLAETSATLENTMTAYKGVIENRHKIQLENEKLQEQCSTCNEFGDKY